MTFTEIDEHEADSQQVTEPGFDPGFTDDDTATDQDGYDAPSPIDPHAEPGTRFDLWTGDEGRLREDQRRALIALWKHRFITTETYPAHYAVIAASPTAINSRLNDHFAVLVLDRERGVAWKTQAPFERSGGAPFPTMMTSTTWSLEETLLLVRARLRYREEQAAGGDAVFIDRADMHDYVKSSWPPLKDTPRPQQRIDNAIETLLTCGILMTTPDADRFRVQPVIDALLSHQVLLQLLEWASPDDPGGSSAPSDGAADDAPDDSDDTDSPDGSGAPASSQEVPA